MSITSKIPKELHEKFDTLKMKPADWTTVWNALGNDEDYREVVRDYQTRQWEALPLCKDWFGVCIYYDRGRCSCRDTCRSKVS